MKTQAVIPAAGRGIRFKQKKAKPLVFLNGKPLIVHTLGVFEHCSLIDSVIIAAPKELLAQFRKITRHYCLQKVVKIVAGGKTRRRSVANGLRVLDQDTQMVVVHDAARPFLTGAILAKSIAVAHRYPAAVVAVPVKSTVKSVDPKTLTVKKTLERKTLWEIQTPQVFKKDVILKAHKTVKDKDPSDDALLVERLGYPVKIIAGDYRNIKITTPEDLILGKAILRSVRKHQ